MTETTATETTYDITVPKAGAYTIPDTPVFCREGRQLTPPRPNGEVLKLFVTGAYSEYGERFINHVVEVFLHSGPEQYFTYNPGGRFLYGSPVNPAPVHGRYYRLLNQFDESAPHGALVQYIDHHHTGDRHNAANPWNVVAGINNNPWPLPNDSFNLVTSPYIEVEPPADLVGRPTEAPETIDAGFDGPAMGLAEQDSGTGRALKNPELVDGNYYIAWRRDAAAPTEYCYLTVYTGTASGEGGYLRATARMRRDGQRLNTVSITDVLLVGNLHWAKARMAPPAEKVSGEQEQALLSGLRLRLSNSTARFAEFNEALNEKAREQEWCSEYEGVIVPLGMEPREVKKNWVISVTAHFETTDDSPSSSVDNVLSEQYDVEDLSLTTVTMSGKVTVKLRVSEMTEDEARNWVDRYEVENELAEMFPGSASCTDWDIDGIEEDD